MRRIKFFMRVAKVAWSAFAVFYLAAGAPRMALSSCFGAATGFVIDAWLSRRPSPQRLRVAVHANIAMLAACLTVNISVSGGLTSPLDTPLTDAQRELATNLRGSGALLLTMLNDLLDFSKIEAGRLELEDAPFELRPMLARCCALYAAQSQRKGLTLIDEVDAALPAWVSGDAVRLTQVLLNLVGNAVKFTSAGDGRVRARFAVSDTGIGMNDSVRARLFQPFTQGDGSTTRRYGGTGLGLFICKRLVALMGGHFEVESAPDRGSTFAFSLELGVAAPPAPSPRATPTPPPERVGRVLVAEDNEVNQVLIEHLLASMGLTAVLVGNGRDAVEAVREGGFDAVLMDCHMPEMDGFDATRAIRAHEAGARRIPVVACSAGVTADEQARCLDAGVDGFLSKPIDRPRLAAALARWFSGS